MGEISVRELRNNGGRVLDRVEQGEVLVVTRNRKPVAELRPLMERGLTAELLLKRWQGLPDVDPGALRREVASVLDTEL